MPTLNRQKINKLKTIMSLADEDLTRKDFMDTFRKAFSHIVEFERKTTEKLKGVAESLTSDIDRKTKTLENTLNKQKDESEEKLQKLTNKVEERLSNVRDGRDADESMVIKKVTDILTPLIPEEKEVLPEEIRNKLESLLGEDRLKIEAIHNLRKELDELKKGIKTSSVSSGWSAASGGKIVKVHDLSSSLDGSTATFSLPAFYRVLTVDCSSFPNALRPTVDYTVDGSAMTITFTSEIDPATTLAAGQTVIITYAEP